MNPADEPTDPVEPETEADAKPTPDRAREGLPHAERLAGPGVAPDRAREGLPLWATWLAALPMLYVLSIGPVVMIADKAGLSPRPFRKFYAPVIWLHDHTVLKQPIEWYAELWGVK
jgi:hypothetical protein